MERSIESASPNADLIVSMNAYSYLTVIWNWTPPNFRNKRRLTPFWWEGKNVPATLVNGLVVSYKGKHIPTH